MQALKWMNEKKMKLYVLISADWWNADWTHFCWLTHSLAGCCSHFFFWLELAKVLATPFNLREDVLTGGGGRGGGGGDGEAGTGTRDPSAVFQFLGLGGAGLYCQPVLSLNPKVKLLSSWAFSYNESWLAPAGDDSLLEAFKFWILASNLAVSFIQDWICWSSLFLRNELFLGSVW